MEKRILNQLVTTTIDYERFYNQLYNILKYLFFK